jgi:uncharacterized protein YlxP (DUF503 family)
MWTGILELDVVLGDVRSLKEKRSVIRPVVAELRRRFAVAAAETDHLDLHRRSGIGVAVVAADRAHCVEVLSAAERLVGGRPELELLSARSRFVTTEDLPLLESDRGGSDPASPTSGAEAGDRAGWPLDDAAR